MSPESTAPAPAFKHIICGVDGSGPACRAARLASQLAIAVGAQLSYVTVAREGRVEPDVEKYRSAEGLGEEPVPVLGEAAEKCLDMAMMIAREQGVDGAKRVVRTGHVAAELAAAAEQSGADALVLGHHVRSDIARLVRRSISSNLADENKFTLVLVP